MRATGARLVSIAIVPALALVGLAGCGSQDRADLSDDDAVAMQENELSTATIGNPGFESDWSGWTRVSPTGLSGVAHSGSRSAKVSATTGQIKRTVSGLSPGTSYTLSAYVLGYARVGARNYGGSTVSKPVNASSWTKVSVSFTTGSSSTSAQIFASWVSGGDARVDDFVLAAASTTTASSTGGCSYPSQILDVSSWKLQLPVGDPTIEIKNPQLAGYSKSPLFRSDSTCSAVRFRAPTDGTTTSGAEYPRTELREMTADGREQAKWSTTSGTHTMFIDQAVTALPRGKRSIGAGQIHDSSNDILLIRVEGSSLFLKPRGSPAVVLDSSYTLGKRFTIKLVAGGGIIKAYYNGRSTPSLTMSKSSSSAYFKAGAYPQSNCDTEAQHGATCGSDDYGEVAIYDLVIKHS